MQCCASSSLNTLKYSVPIYSLLLIFAFVQSSKIRHLLYRNLETLIWNIKISRNSAALHYK